MTALAERLRYDALVSPAAVPEPARTDPMMQTGSSFMGATVCPQVDSAHYDGKTITLRMRSLLNPGSSLVRGSIRLPPLPAALAVFDQMGASDRPPAEPATFEPYGRSRLT